MRTHCPVANSSTTYTTPLSTQNASTTRCSHTEMPSRRGAPSVRGQRVLSRVQNAGGRAFERDDEPRAHDHHEQERIEEVLPAEPRGDAHRRAVG